MTDVRSQPNGKKLSTETNSILPGSTVGILGGGQLGRMLAIAARRMGYRIHVYDPSPNCPAGQICDLEVNAPYTDSATLEEFARGVDVLTFEFENIPKAALETVATIRPVRPRADVLHICQNREREKLFLQEKGFPCAPFRVVDSADSLASAIDDLGFPCVLKTADFGYDGKGQLKLAPGANPAEVWKSFAAPRGVLEAWIPFQAELSVVCARGIDGETIPFPPSENIHRNHILDLSIVPARLAPDVLAEATRLACAITTALAVTGLLAVEFFLDSNGKLLVNELAPRPHNSGHFSFDACATSQFEQQLRAVCGLPLGAPDILKPVVMLNLLGDLWENGDPDWSHVLSDPMAKLHLYGKSEARRGRKMGHICLMAETIEQAMERVEAIRSRLS